MGMEIDEEFGEQDQQERKALPDKLQLEVLKCLDLPRARELLPLSSTVYKNIGPKVAKNWLKWEVCIKNWN